MDCSNQFVEQIGIAYAAEVPLVIEGGRTKEFLGSSTSHPTAVLRTNAHTGVLKYSPEELVIQARSGTLLTEIEACLAEHNQVLAFDPPHFGPAATIGGCVAAGLSGPGRPYLGSARDFVLGVSIINGGGELLGFGGQVMKNVAGYDVSRLMVGAMGTLGLIVDVSLRVLPGPRLEETRSFEINGVEALSVMRGLARKSVPVTATCHGNGRLYVRLSGEPASLQKAGKLIGGDLVEEGDRFWRSVRDQECELFDVEEDLWRLSVPPSAPLAESARLVIEWGGAQRWYQGVDSSWARSQAERLGGHAMLFRSIDNNCSRFQPLEPELMSIHQKLKQAFDPAGILNPGRMYAEI